MDLAKPTAQALDEGDLFFHFGMFRDAQNISVGIFEPGYLCAAG
jgi:hypothetical protein